jgi:phosphate/sulfate permease
MGLGTLAVTENRQHYGGRKSEFCAEPRGALTGYFATWAGMLVSMTRIMTDSSFGMRPLDKHIDKIGVTLAVASSVG